jgi:hypothetical protein
MVTGEQVKAAVLKAGIKQVDHHDCAGCGYMTRYVIEGDQLYFDPGCHCSRYGYTMAEPRSWDSAADWINMQSRPDVAAKIAAMFGLDLAST